MHIDKLTRVTIVTADSGKYLKLKEYEDSEEIIGKPVRMIFDNHGNVPEFEEGAMK